MSFGPNSLGADAWTEQRFDIPSRPTDIWIEFMLRVPDNYKHRDESPNNNKLFAIWADDYGASNKEAHVVYEFKRVDDFSSRLRPSSAKADGYETRDPDEDGWTIKGILFSEDMRGTWIRLRFHIRSEVDASVMDLWRDDTKIAELVADYSIANPQWDKNYFFNAYLLGWSNAGYEERTDFYIDDFRIYTGDPGW